MIIVSACLAGKKCRYDAKSCKNKYILNLIKRKKVILVCPEKLGGLSTPRPSVEKKKNKFITADGKDLTLYYRKGAIETLKIAKLYNCKVAILKSNSPSCGKNKIYDGTFTGKLIKGEGETAKLLRKNKIIVYDENEFEKFHKILN